MKLSDKELAIIDKLIDLNNEFFQAKKMDNNPIVNQINDNPSHYGFDEQFVFQKDLVELKYKIWGFFDTDFDYLNGRKKNVSS